MTKQEIKQLIIENYNSKELYTIRKEVKAVEEKLELENKPSLEKLLEICKEIYIVGSYIKILPQNYKEDSRDTEYGSDILGISLESSFKTIVYAKLTDLKITEQEICDPVISLYYDFCQICEPCNAELF
jgi:hypothetical protein